MYISECPVPFRVLCSVPPPLALLELSMCALLGWLELNMCDLGWDGFGKVGKVEEHNMCPKRALAGCRLLLLSYTIYPPSFH